MILSAAAELSLTLSFRKEGNPNNICTGFGDSLVQAAVTSFPSSNPNVYFEYCNRIYSIGLQIQGSAKRRGLGCVNSLPGSAWLLLSKQPRFFADLFTVLINAVPPVILVDRVNQIIMQNM